ncbi:MAG: ribose 5-phosphate isomerase A [Thermoleophilaceae bacterium]|nr:ribose 5-phosphate isomerase A [Thermoleophilaceae bacterium]
MGSDEQNLARHAAARAAMEMLPEGDTIGLGSGRAVWAVIEALRDRWPSGPPLRAVCASSATDTKAREAGIEVLELDGELALSVAVDGADEVGPSLGLLKGGGGALLREKLVISAAERFVCVAETAKLVPRLGATRGLPVEVARFAWRDTRRRLLESGLVGDAVLRVQRDGEPYRTDEGHHILDCAIPERADDLAPGAALGAPEANLRAWGATLAAVPGVMEHGLFIDMADVVLLGTPEGELETLQA